MCRRPMRLGGFSAPSWVGLIVVVGAAGGVFRTATPQTDHGIRGAETTARSVTTTSFFRRVTYLDMSYH